MSPAAGPPGESRLALPAAVVCYGFWGLLPLLFIVIGRAGVSPWELLAQRALWGAPCAAALVWLSGQAPQARAVFSNPKLLGQLALSATLIACNWSVFVWAVNNGHNLEASFGYFVNPLLVMGAGALLFGERIPAIGLAAMGVAAVGVVLQAVAIGHPPWVALALASSFAAYAIIRKRVAADAQTGLFVECLLMVAPALGLWCALRGTGHAVFGRALVPSLLLAACGPGTIAPLALFAWTARRLSFSTVGFLQFLSPSITFMIGVAIGEPLKPLQVVSFVFIWGGAGLFGYGAWRAGRRLPRPA